LLRGEDRPPSIFPRKSEIFCNKTPNKIKKKILGFKGEEKKKKKKRQKLMLKKIYT